MKRYKFRLETVLRYRETIENLREQDFQTAQGLLIGIERKRDALRDEYRETLLGRPGGTSGENFDAHGICDRERYIETLLAGIATQERILEAARIVVEEARRALVVARQAREAVTQLREKDYSAYIAQSLQLEQATLDELATLRYTREMNSA